MSSKIIGSTKVAKIDRIHVRMSYEAIIGSAAARKTEDLVTGLEAFFAGKVPADVDPNTILSQCDVCMGWSDPSVGPDSCPYCNDGNPVAAEQEEPKAAESVTKEEEPKAAATPDPEPDADTEGGTVIDAAAIIADGETVRVPAAEIKQQRMVRRMPAAVKPSAPLISIAGGKSLASPAQLDEAILRFYRASHDTADGNYAMGIELRKMRDHLWQQKLGEDGKPKYKSFEQFCVEELKFSKTYAYRLMSVVENFTPGQWRAYGPEVLKMLAGAPKEMHQSLLEKADKGATTRQLEQEIRAGKEAMGVVVAPPAEGKEAPRTNAATIAAAEKRQKARAEKASTNAPPVDRAAITVGLKNQSFSSTFLARGALPGQPAPAKDGKGAKFVLPEEVAQFFRDVQPYAMIEGINGVKVAVALTVDSKGQLVMKGEAKRVKDGEEAAA